MNHDCVFTSESVTEGHPDKLCDQISDAIVDRFLYQDPRARVATECAVSTGILFIAAHFAAEGSIDVPGLAREVIRSVGYRAEEIDARSCSIMTSLNELPDEERAGDAGSDGGAQDDQPATEQVTVFGYACRQTATLMPLPISLAHALARGLTAARRCGELPWLAADGKTQVAVEYEGRRPVRIHGVSVVASQRSGAAPSLATLRRDVRDCVIEPIFAEQEVRPDEHTRWLVNPSGPVVIGGPSLHSGVTGRKTAADTYGEWVRHSGAALSGKDPSRIDRIGAYAARHAAKNVVAAGLANECEVQLSYTIGLASPVSVQVDSFGSGRLPDAEIVRRVRAQFDFRVGGIARGFGLRALPERGKGDFYRRLASYGQVGRDDLELPWERTDRADALRES